MGAFTFKGLNLRNLVRAAFDATDGHDHDGVNSNFLLQITYTIAAAS